MTAARDGRRAADASAVCSAALLSFGLGAGSAGIGLDDGVIVLAIGLALVPALAPARVVVPVVIVHVVIGPIGRRGGRPPAAARRFSISVLVDCNSLARATLGSLKIR